MDLTKDDYILGLWFFDAKHFDWLLIVKRGEHDTHWIGEYRFAYRNGDVKKYTVTNINYKEAEIIKHMNQLFYTMIDAAKMFFDEINMSDILLVQGGFDKFLKLAADKPDWVKVTTQYIH